MPSERPVSAEMYDDGVSDERRAAAIAHLQASFTKERDKDETRVAEQSRPALSAEERKRREGFSTIPITPEIRAMISNADQGIEAQRRQMLMVLGLVVGVEVLIFGLAFAFTGDLAVLAIFGVLTAEAPPAPRKLAKLSFHNWERHQDWVGAEWRTLDFVVTRRGPLAVHGTIIALRDDHDRLLYDYQDG
ncbi:MAG: hypothetical protein LC793_12085 [Thermomicrobia bacterium]|nr:hypothetical protein [Thermomicrobia bacterium]